MRAGTLHLLRCFVFSLLLCGAAGGDASAMSLMPKKQQEEGAAARREPVLIERNSGGRVEIQAEIARTPEQKAQGFMFREKIPQGTGMLFVCSDPAASMSMWMKNTPSALDILFLDAQGLVVDTHERAEPHSLTSIRPARRACGAMELPAGEIARLGLGIGDRVLHDSFPAQSSAP